MVPEPSYYTNFFSEKLLAIEMRRTLILMNKSVYLVLSILEISQIVMYKFCYDYVKLEYGYRQLYSHHKNKRHLHRDCKGSWKMGLILQIKI